MREATARATRAGIENPFPGLRAFGPEESHLFFGREEHVDELLALLRERRFVAVVGSSGSGKSSLVLAGLLPTLDGGVRTAFGSQWRVARMRPGDDPVGHLAEALHRPDVFGAEDDLEVSFTKTTLQRSRLGLVEVARQHLGLDGPGRGESGDAVRPGNLLVLVDQFEELFRFRAQVRGPTDAATAFVHLLLEAARAPRVPLHVLITMRSDFLGDCVQFAGLAEAINQGQYLVPRLTRRQREAVIVGPIRVGGADVAQPLLQRLLNDVGDNPDQLPILQHALMRTFDLWLQRGALDEPLGLADYEAAGTMSHALSDHAEEAYAELDARGQAIAAVLFKCLTEGRGDGDGIRRPTRVEEICAVAGAGSDEVAAVAERFRAPGRAFLTCADETLSADSVLDISHESLMRVWERLRDWVREEQEDVEYYRRLVQATELHAAGEAGLWRDPELELALKWWHRKEPNATWAGRYGLPFEPVEAFLEDSRIERDWELAEREEAQQRELRQAQALAEAEQRRAKLQRKAAARLRRGLLAVGVALLLAVVAFAGAWWQREQAEEESRRAEEAYRQADQQRTSAEVAEIGALAASVSHIAANGHWFDALLQAQRAGRKLKLLRQHAEPPANLEVEVTAALTEALYGVHEHDRWTAHVSWPNALAYSPAGGMLVTAGYGQTVKRWRPDGSELAPYEGHGAAVFAVAVSSQGVVASGDEEGEIRLWWGPERFRRVGEAHGGSTVRGLDFHPGGQLLASAGDDGTVELRSLDGTLLDTVPLDLGRIEVRGRRGEVLSTSRLEVSSGSVRSVRFDRTGDLLAAGGEDGTVAIWRLQAGDDGLRLERRIRFRAHTGSVRAVDFDPAGRRLVTGGMDGRVVAWTLDGEEDRSFDARAPVQALRVSRHGWVAAGCADSTVRVWKPDGQMHAYTTHNEPVVAVDFSPDGAYVASTSTDLTVKRWQLVNPFQETLTAHRGTVWSVDVDATGARVASGGEDNTVRLYALDGRLLATYEGHEKLVRDVRFDHAGRRLASASHDGTVRLWDVVGDREPLVLVQDGQGGVNTVDFSPDDELVAGAVLSTGLRVWSAADGALRPDLGRDVPQIWGARYGPRGGLLGVLSDGRVFLRSPGGEEDGFRPGQTTGIPRGVFSPDGTRYATCSHIGDAVVWSRDGEELYRLRGHARGVNDVAFTADGRYLATAGLDGDVRLWNAEDGSLYRIFRGHSRALTGVAFTPDGKTMLSSSADETVKIWRDLHIDLDHLMVQAQLWLEGYQRHRTDGAGD